MRQTSSLPAPTRDSPTGGVAALRATILVVDSSAWLRAMFTTLLGYLGYQSVTASTGTEALTAFMHHRPAAMIIDSRLPDMTVGDLGARIQRVAQVPMILMTGGDSDLNRHVLASLPAAATLNKPFTITDVRDGLRACLAPPSPAQPAPPTAAYQAGRRGRQDADVTTLV